MQRPMFDVDFPDPDIIRVDNTYYMLSTSMYFFPGCEIVSSTDLISWKHETYVYDYLDQTPAQRLESGNIYGKGMWAASFRYHKGTFYICFVANDTHSTYLFRSDAIKGPWKMSKIQGFYHDCSLLFDDDDKVYIAYGNREIYVTELNEEMTAPKENGFHRMVVRDNLNNALGYEGTHFYKINGVYYLFFIHSLEGKWFRSESCYYSKSLLDEFKGGEVFTDDNNYLNSGIAQGAIVDTPNGDWYAVLFQDRGGSGRIPYLIPMHFEGVLPVIGDNGKLPVCEQPTYSNNANKLTTSGSFISSAYGTFIGSDDFKTIYDTDSCYGFKNIWQFNHEPDMSLITRNTALGSYSVTTNKICSNPTEAINSLTQRMSEIISCASVTVDTTSISSGDYAGFTALQYLYGFIGITKKEDSYYIVYMEKSSANEPDKTTIIKQISSPIVTFRISTNLGKGDDYAQFSYKCVNYDSGFTTLEIKKPLPFMLEHFTGYRYALTYFSTQTPGGIATFSNFVYE